MAEKTPDTSIKKSSVKRGLSLKIKIQKEAEGALIMTSNTHLLSQIETLISELDIHRELRVSVNDDRDYLPTNFSKYDIILTTPTKLYNEKSLLNQNALGLNPEVVVFDEFDTCFTEGGMKMASINLLEILEGNLPLFKCLT